ncbi:Zinc finger BED domain-containing protein DAYSLEEPER [Linum grandiflorum]
MEGEGTQQVNVVAAADQQPVPQPQQADVQLAANQHPENAQQAENVEVVPLGNRRKSEVWDHFDRIKVHGILKAKCHYCRKLLGGHSTSGTSHLWNHINICIHKKIHDGRQKIMGPKLVGKSKRDVSAIAYNAEVSRKELAIAIVMHEYPLSMVDHLYFKRFICSLQPQFTVPSRNTIKKDIMSIYMAEKTKIQRGLDANNGSISITTDMWTASNQKRGYMAIIGHYNDNSWDIRNHLLR